MTGSMVLVASAANGQDTRLVQTTPPPMLFNADFDDESLEGWTFDAAAVSIVQDEGSTVLSLAGNQLDGSSAVIQGGDQWTDYVVDLRLKIVEADPDNELADLAVIVRADTQSSDFAAIFLSTSTDQVIIGSVVDNQIIDRHSAPFTFESQVWYDLRVGVQGSAITLFIDGQPIAETQVSGPPPQGTVGLLTLLGTVVYVDAARVTALTEGAAPAQVPTLANGLPASTATPAAEPTITLSSGVVVRTPTPTVERRGTGTPIPSVTLARSSPTPTPGLTIPPTNTPHHTGPTPISMTGAYTEVTVPLANLRDGPGTNYDIGGSAQGGDLLAVVAQATIDGQTWYLVQGAAGYQGWIWSGLVRLTPANADVPTMEIFATPSSGQRGEVTPAGANG